MTVEAHHSANNWSSFSKLLSTIAILSGCYQKNFEPNQSRIEGGSQSPVYVKTTKKTRIHLFSLGRLFFGNFGAHHSPNNWPSYSKLLSTIATLCGSYQKNFQPIRSRIKRGSQSCIWLKTAKKHENCIFSTLGDPGPQIQPQGWILRPKVWPEPIFGLIFYIEKND